jgi:hypothetical protein
VGQKGTYAILILFLLCGISFASETAYEKKIALGVAALESGTYDQAISYFEGALSERPDDLSATLYEGIARSRGKKEGAEESLKKALAISPDDPRTNLELGIFYYGIGMVETAAGYFEKTVLLAPGSDMAALGREYLDTIRSIGGGKPWRINLWGGVQYDSNVILSPDNGPLPQGISRKSDWRAVFFLDSSYKFIQRSGLACSFGYGFYQSLHRSLSDFNVTQNMVTLAASYKASSSVKLGATYLMDYAMVGGNGYYAAHGITPSVSIAEGKDYTTVIEYRYRSSHFMDSDLFRGNADRTGSNNAFGIMQTARIGSTASVRIGYARDEDRTRKDFWDFSGDRCFAGILYIPVKNTTIDLSGEYYRKTFKGPSPFSSTGEIRKDDIYTAAVSVSRKLSERFTVILGYLHMKNRSNVAAFDFGRSMTSLMLSARF